MVIMVQRGHEDVKNYLIKKGYHVVDDNPSSYHDIYIYGSSSYEGLFNNLMSNENLFQYNASNRILMINMNNRSLQEVEEMINRRKYSNLFESEGLF